MIRMKKQVMLIAIVAMACLIFTGAAKAASFTGTISVVDLLNPTGVSFTNDSFTLNQVNYVISGGTGTFVTATVPVLSDVTAYDTIVNIPSSPGTDVIPDFLELSSPDTLAALGTSPSNLFDFNLATITETADSGSTATFAGTGTLVDNAVSGPLSNTPASIFIAYSSQSAYTITLTATPEPSTWALMLGGLGLLVFLRKRVRQS
jgi:hypothetical protein